MYYDLNEDFRNFQWFEDSNQIFGLVYNMNEFTLILTVLIAHYEYNVYII